ncbi:helix-turn-helix domain-containing protein [Bdellovibrionota bacterium FG-1]
MEKNRNNNKGNRSGLTGAGPVTQNQPCSTATPPGAGSLKIREWLTTEQAADYLGLSIGALMNMISNGLVPYYKFGRRNRYLLVELRQLLLSQKRGSSHGN